MEDSRVIDPNDFSVRPSRDTGFRMATPILTEPYTSKKNPLPSHPLIDYVHNDDLVDIGPGTLRGIPLNAVRLYTINYEQAEKRVIGDIRRNVMKRCYPNDSACLCLVPGFAPPCTECGAGL